VTVEWHGYIGDVKHFEVCPNIRRRKVGRHERWLLLRCAPGSYGGIEPFQNADLAMRWAAKLNPKIEWRKVRITPDHAITRTTT